MSHYDSITKIKICWSLYCNGVSSEEIPVQLGIHRATVYRWIKGIKLKGINKFIRQYKNAKKGRRKPNKTDVITKLPRITKLACSLKTLIDDVKLTVD